MLSFDYYQKNGDIGQLHFINVKNIIDDNPRLKFENIFIKAFRKDNQGHDDFINRQIDKPGFEIELREEKRRVKNVSPVKEIVVEEKPRIESKEEEKIKIVSKVKPVKTKIKTTNTKKPIGVPLKPNEKREEDKKLIETNPGINPTTVINKYDNIPTEYWEYNNYYQNQRNLYYKAPRQNNFYQQPIKNIPQTADVKVDTKPIEKKESPRPTTNELKDQYMSFVPDIFTKKVSEEEPKSDKKDETNELIENFKKFDFTNIFAKEEEVEEDLSSNHYQSEREKLFIEDSGTEERREEIKFNFNSIFGGSGMKLITPVNDYVEDIEEPKDNLDGNKPYFDKGLFLSFDAAFNKPQSNIFTNSGSSLFSANPFASVGHKKVLEDLLKDENQPELDENRDKLDDISENEYDDEEDPLWCDEHIDTKNDGYFDETGAYRLKQMDINFDYDFNKKL
jgi:hypothetical protein